MSVISPAPVDRPDPFRDCWPRWHREGWEVASEDSVRDATKVTRGQAHASMARDYGWENVGVWKRYIRALSRQEQWEYRCEDEDEPPADFEPNESDPWWEFVHRSHPEAWPVWVVGELRLGAPRNPLPPVPSGHAESENQKGAA